MQSLYSFKCVNGRLTFVNVKYLDPCQLICFFTVYVSNSWDLLFNTHEYNNVSVVIGPWSEVGLVYNSINKYVYLVPENVCEKGIKKGTLVVTTNMFSRCWLTEERIFVVVPVLFRISSVCIQINYCQTSQATVMKFVKKLPCVQDNHVWVLYLTFYNRFKMVVAVVTVFQLYRLNSSPDQIC